MLRPCRGDAEAVAGAVRDADAVLVGIAGDGRRDRRRAAPEGIVRYGIGVDNIDRDAATARLIYVANVPDYGTEDVSDHAMALLLAVARRVPSRDAYVRGGGWYSGSREKTPARGQDPGLLGYGRIAQAFERKMRGFGIARVLVFDLYADLPPGVEAASVDTAGRPTISLHAPLTAETRHILGAERLALLKPTAIVVNTSRGALIDEEALAAALGGVGGFGAGLDVFETEPPAAGHPLLRLPNVVLSDHAGWYSEESVAELQRKGRGGRPHPVRSAAAELDQSLDRRRCGGSAQVPEAAAVRRALRPSRVQEEPSPWAA